MPLPTLTMPAALPAFLVQSHAAQWGDPFGNVPMTTGHPRKRRRWTSAPQRQAVSLLLERDEMTAFHAWHRDSLKSGQRRFSARVKKEGAGELWYSALFFSMYQTEALHFGRWRVAADLMLDGDGSVAGPNIGLLAAEIVVPFTGSGTISVEKLLSAEISIDFLVSEES